MRKFKITLLFLSLLSAAYTVSPSSGVLSLLFIIPLFYGVLYFFLVPDKMMPGPGYTTMNFVLFIRYIILPPILKYYDFKIDLINVNDYILMAIFISIVEIIVILLVIKFSFNQNIKYVSVEERPIRKRLPIILCIIAIISIMYNPDVVANMHFILNPEMIISDKKVLSSDVWFKIFEWAQVFIVLFLASMLYSKYRSFWLIAAVTLVPCLFYSGHSRLSLLLPVVTTMFFIMKLFPEKRRSVVIVFSLFALFAMGSLTIAKQFRVESIREISDFQLVDLLGAYVGGISNVAKGLYANDFYSDQIGLSTMINDMFRNGMGISTFFSSNNNSVYYFNQVFYSYSYDQIIPTVCQGVFYFGYFFFWIPTLIMVKLILYSDNVFFNSSKIEYVWAFSFFSVAIGWSVPGSFQHVYMNFHGSLLPLLILGFVNRVDVIKFIKQMIFAFYTILIKGLKKNNCRIKLNSL